jgi:hypothetical protein
MPMEASEVIIPHNVSELVVPVLAYTQGNREPDEPAALDLKSVGDRANDFAAIVISQVNFPFEIVSRAWHRWFG